MSLTVGEVETDSFRVYIIPKTRELTLFGTYRAGDEVNIEADILAKYAAKAMAEGGRAAGGRGTEGLGAWRPQAREVFEAWERGDR